MKQSTLALLGGEKTVTLAPKDMFTWPILTQEDERAVLEVLRRGGMSGTDVTKLFERDYAQWMGVKYALGHSSGTAALEAAMFGCGVGEGDEIICPSITYWASCLQCMTLGATVVFADIDPHSLCIDPRDIERHISPRTKAIVAVHYLGHPADMDPIMRLARKHKIKVIEDVSHAHGGLYKGRKVGSMGDVAGYSLMTGKSLAIGEAGMLTTNNPQIYERAIAWGHYERFNAQVKDKWLSQYRDLPLGGHKYRMHQLSAAMGRVQLARYDQRSAEIRKAMNYFWDLLGEVPGIEAHRPTEKSGSTMGGWYAAHGIYHPESLGGLSVTHFCEAVTAEGASCTPGCNRPLHLHPLLNTCDVYGHGKPTRIAFSARDVRQAPGSLPVSESIGARTYSVPWFKHYRPQVIRQYAAAFKKVATHAEALLKRDPGNPKTIGGWNFFHR